MAFPQTDSILGREETMMDLPQRPPPARHSHRSSRHSRRGGQEDYLYSTQQKHPSVSSAGETHRTDGASIDLEKQALGDHYRKAARDSWSPHSSVRASRDVRRQHSQDSLYQVGRGSDSSPHHQTIRHIDDDGQVTSEKGQPDRGRPLKLLIYFLAVLPLLSFALALWAILATLAATITHPVRLIFTRERSLSAIILTCLEPALSFHLERIGAFRQAAVELQLPHTILVLATSALLSVGFMVWAMVLGVFWVFAAVIGNPDGLDGRSDGRDLTSTTRQKWEDWLKLAVRPELRS